MATAERPAGREPWRRPVSRPAGRPALWRQPEQAAREQGDTHSKRQQTRTAPDRPLARKLSDSESNLRIKD
jgi:hypothetical protein